MRTLSLVALFCVTALAAPAPAPFEVEVLATRPGVVWGFDFLPDGRILLTERAGRLILLDPKTGAAAPVSGVPEVYARGQGGLLDIRLHPKFAKNRWVYLTWAMPVQGGATTALGRGRLEGAALKDFRVLFTAKDPADSDIHFGSRLEFLDGRLFMTVGERNRRHQAQDLGRHMGKVLRLTEDGAPAPNNPFAGKDGALPEIWSLGHRNPQGLAARPKSLQLWSAEFGPRGGDELNLIKPGANYGWPVITYGREYWGPKIGEGSAKEGLEQPVAKWVPSISPSALAFYDGKAFPAWRGSAFLACLSGSRLQRLTLEGDSVVAQESLLAGRGWRFRAVRGGPDGFLYFSTDEGLLARLVPK